MARRIDHSADIDDLLQRTMMAVLDALPRFRGEVTLSGYARAIAAKLVLRHRRDEHRARRRAEPDVSAERLAASNISAPDLVACHDATARLRGALEGLSPANAELLRLRYWDELPTAEIAERLATTVGAARVRLHRARKQLKAVLEATEPKASSSDLWPRVE